MHLFKVLLLWFVLLMSLKAEVFLYPIPQDYKYDKQKALLGKMLFFEPMLSTNGQISCASCHTFYTSPKITTSGNPATLLNVALNFSHKMNGGFEDLQSKLLKSEHYAKQMKLDKTLVVKRLESSPLYAKKFEEIFKKPDITFENVIECFVEFENALTTPDSKFDKYLRGELLLNENESLGYTLFNSYGCVSCHNGVNIGGNSFQMMGLVVPVEETNGTSSQNGKMMRVPTLRNISQTAPYYHDGSISKLEDAVKFVGKHNLGVDIKEEDVGFIVDFLKTLDGKRPEILSE